MSSCLLKSGSVEGAWEKEWACGYRHASCSLSLASFAVNPSLNSDNWMQFVSHVSLTSLLLTD